MTFIDELAGSIGDKISQINEETASLETARKALIGSASGKRAANGSTPAQKPAPAKRSRKAAAKPLAASKPEVLLSGQLEAMLQSTEGLSARAISQQASAAYKQVTDLLHELEAAGKVRSTGARRTRLWKLHSDESGAASKS